MKSKFLALALVAAAALAPLAARADDEVSFETFYDNLAPYGEWIELGDYGNCWHPTGVDADWAPYTDGYWSYTDAGWTWISYEDFGDITYHYGRWVSVDDVGWCWVPDYEWGPAWVSWRQDDENIGWAPLPPEAQWDQTAGLSVWVDEQYDIGPEYYNFCPVDEFSAPVIRHVCLPRVAVISIFARSVNITNISWYGSRHHVFCGGPNFTVINARLRRPIPTLKLVQNTTIINNNVTVINNRRVVKFPRGHVAGNTLNVFAPKIVRKNVTNIHKPQITRVVQKDKVNRGWKLQNQGEVARLREKVKSENKGRNPQTAPAREVAAADLKPVPERANPKGPSPVGGQGDRRRDNDRDGNGKPDRAVADRPDKGPGEGKLDRPGKGPDADGKPDRPERIAGDRPGRGPDAADKPDRPGRGADVDQRPDRTVADDGKPGRADDKERPGHGGGNPLVRPFNEQRGDGEAGAGAGPGMGKKQAPDANDGPAQAERQRQAAAERTERQQQAAAERQRAVAAQAERQQRAAEAKQRQMEAQRGGGDGAESAQRPPQPQRDPAERQAAQAQRQEQLQRQAEAQQRQLQLQRQQQMQRQQQQQQPPQHQPSAAGGGQQRQQPAQGQGGGGGGKGRQLTPEEREALKKQRGY